MRDIEVVALVKIIVRANTVAEAIEWVECCEGAPIDNDGMIGEVLSAESARSARRRKVLA